MRLEFAILFCLISGSGFAEEQEIIPSEFPVSRYSSIWEDSPFNREVVAQVTVVAKSVFAANFVLEGLVTDEQAGHIAYVRDLAGDKFLVVSSDKSGDPPLYLVQATKSNNPAETVVTISNGTEDAEITYADGVFTKKIDAPATTPSQQANGAAAGNAISNEGEKGTVNNAKASTSSDKADNKEQTVNEPTPSRRRILLPRSTP